MLRIYFVLFSVFVFCILLSHLGMFTMGIWFAFLEESQLQQSRGTQSYSLTLDEMP